MDDFPWLEVTIAVIGIVVPAVAFLYEFVYKGRKRLGYRVQMDTLATDAVRSEYAGALQRLQRDGTKLIDPSFVLLRVENNGVTHVDTKDYAVLDDDKVGIRVGFPGRTVAGMVITELSDGFLDRSFGKDSGLNVEETHIDLPKVPLNPGQHYKVLAVLQRDTNGKGVAKGPNGEYPDPEIVGGIKGGIGSGTIQETKSHTGTSRAAIALVTFLVMVVVAQLTVSLTGNASAPLDCARGELHLTGSSAFAPVLRDAADGYAATCPDSAFTFDLRGSGEGIRRLGESKTPKSTVAFSDGPKGSGFPRLIPRPIAFSLFTLVINKDAQVRDLTLDEIRRIHAGEITNWKELGGADLPVRLVGRHESSGTRRTFQKRVLDGRLESGVTSENCRDRADGAPRGPLRCERGDTGQLLAAVTATEGALGYAELGAVSGRDDLALVHIDGHLASVRAADHDAYPFWETEYAYTHDDPEADSLAAGFLRYLTNEVGRDIARSHGHRPCAELANPVLCHPT